ncbi:MAG: PmoA family protein [Opitutus sp.]
MRVSLLSLVLLATGTGLLAADAAPDVKLTKLNDRVRVEIGGKLFTEYVHSDGATRPYCYPILAQDGTAMTRDFPMKETAGEDTDHPWHRSLWFAHSMVNGVDFWNEGTGDVGRSPKDKGKTVLDTLLETESGKVGVLRARNRWVAPDGKLICTDERTLRFRGHGDTRMIDYEVTWHALPDQSLLIGDNKDGTMAIRLAQWMTMPHKYQKKDLPGNGHIVTSTGARDADAWGKRADWCDYYAPHDGKVYGVAIFDHPQNLRHPTWWMARDYGLFGANPFGQHDYENLKDQPHIGDYTIPAGGTLTLRYRFVFHPGDEREAKLAELYREYASTKN